MSVSPSSPASDGRGRPTLARLAEALEVLPLPVISVDSHGVTVWQNPAAEALFGDLKGVHYDEVVAPEELRATKERFSRVMLGKASSRARNVIRGMDGQLHTMEVTSTPIYEDGKVVGALGIGVPMASGDGSPARDIRLTRRQRQVLELLARGRTTAQIAEDLHLAPATVRNYISALLRHLGAGSRLEAVVTAVRAGLVSMDAYANPEGIRVTD